MKTPVIERFMSKVSPEPNSGCWLWTAGLNHCGYGVFKLNGKDRMAHRAAYELLKSAIPEGLDLDHLCRNRCCVNPSHLEPVTPYENCRREGFTELRKWHIKQASKPCCPKGHPYDERNTYIGTKGERKCRACHRLRATVTRERRLMERINA